MDSRVFIAEAKELIKDIGVFAKANLAPEAEQVQGHALQRSVNNLFSGLYNPTLPSAFKLRNVALKAGFAVDLRSPIQRQMAWFDPPQGD